MRWTNSWGRGLNWSAGRAPGHCVLRWGQGVPSFPHARFLAPALFLRCASDSFSLTKPNTSRKIEWPASLRSEGVRVHPGMPFGFSSETAFGFAGILRRPLRGLLGQGYGSASGRINPAATTSHRRAFLVSLISTHPPDGALSRTSLRPRPRSQRSSASIASSYHDQCARARNIFILRCGTKDHVLLVPQSRQRINSGRSPCRRIASENRGA